MVLKVWVPSDSTLVAQELMEMLIFRPHPRPGDWTLSMCYVKPCR